MKLLIKNATIIAPNTPLHKKNKDIFIVDGIIKKIASSITEKATKTIAEKGLCVSIGWLDIFSNFCDPGFEYKEDIESGAIAAAAGGFTDVFVLPNNNPVTDNKTQIEYIKQKGKDLVVNIHPIGSVTKDTEGKELAEMYDMHSAGAIAFSDGFNSIQSNSILLKALQYVNAINGVLIQLPNDKSINVHGLINEGIISTQLGLPGKPAIAEELMIARDIELAKYTNSKIHITGVSTKKGIELITNAKKQGINITCSVTAYHIFFCDEDLITYDTNLKVNPVLRTKEDKIALQKALQKNQIDCIASHHYPQSWDDKTCEFEYAKNGMIGLQTVFGVVNSITDNVESYIQMQTVNNRKIFNLPIPIIEEGAVACLTLYNPNNEHLFEESEIKSKSKNSAFVGTTLKGKVIGVINGSKTYFN